MYKTQSEKKWWSALLLAFFSLSIPLLPYLQATTDAASNGQLLDTPMQIVCQSQNCGSITVTLNLPKGVTADKETVTAKRITQVDGGGKLDNFDLINTQGNVWQSGYIFLTGMNSYCETDDSAKSRTVFNISVTGDATGSASNLTTCRKDVPITITTKGTSSKPTTGSIAGTLKTPVIAGGDVGICPAGTSVEITDKKTKTLISSGKVLLDNKGHYDSGQIPPGTYHVAARCAYPAYQSTADIGGDVTVIAGQVANGNLTGDAITRDPTVGTGIDPNAPDPTAKRATCESSGFTLAWIVCPVINLMSDAVEGIYSNIVQPLLETKPLVITPNTVDPKTHLNSNPNLVVWSTFRSIGDIFLIIALLVIVFGQSLGGGLIDAYSAKKILPRLLAAAILINLSYYIVAIAVDVSNIIGGGIQSLILTPFKLAGNTIHVGGPSAGIGIASTLGSTGAIWGIASASAAEATAAAATAAAAAGTTAVTVTTLGAIGAFAIEMIPVLALFVLLPAVLIMLSILAVVIFRQGLILLLVLTAPIAFALYCLPNTEQYFRKWWDLFMKTLLVYPLIAILFALGNVFAITITRAPGPGGPLKVLIAIIALFVPLFLIPFSFKLAGGILGRLHDVIGGGGKKGLEMLKGNPNDPDSLGRRMRYKGKDAVLARREASVRSLKGKDSGWAKRRLGRALDYGNMQATRAKMNQERAEVGRAQHGFGDDSNRRDSLTAWDDGKGATRKAGWFKRMDMEKDESGVLRGVAGADPTYENYAQGFEAKRKALSLYRGHKSDFQENMFYETKKTGFDETQIGRLKEQYSAALGDYGLSEETGMAVAEGVGFNHAGQSLAGKHNKRRKNKETGQWEWKTDIFGLTKDGALQTDNYAWGKQDRATFKEMQSHYETLSDTVAVARQTGLSDDHVLQSGEYKGKTVRHVKQTQKRIESISALTDPAQRAAGAPRIVAEGEDPQAAGLGISSAPVDVQQSSDDLSSAVKSRMTRENRGAPRILASQEIESA